MGNEIKTWEDCLKLIPLLVEFNKGHKITYYLPVRAKNKFKELGVIEVMLRVNPSLTKAFYIKNEGVEHFVNMIDTWYLEELERLDNVS